MSELFLFFRDFCRPEGITSDGSLVYSFKSSTKRLNMGDDWQKIHKDLIVLIAIAKEQLIIVIWHVASDEPEMQRSLPIDSPFHEITGAIAELLLNSSAPYLNNQGE